MSSDEFRGLFKRGVDHVRSLNDKELTTAIEGAIQAGWIIRHVISLCHLSSTLLVAVIKLIFCNMMW